MGSCLTSSITRLSGGRSRKYRSLVKSSSMRGLEGIHKNNKARFGIISRFSPPASDPTIFFKKSVGTVSVWWEGDRHKNKTHSIKYKKHQPSKRGLINDVQRVE